MLTGHPNLAIEPEMAEIKFALIVAVAVKHQQTQIAYVHGLKLAYNSQ